MIEHLRGKLLSSTDDGHIVVDVTGVGYGLDVPRSTLDRLPAPCGADAERLAAGAEVALYVTMLVRDDAMELYGFATAAEKMVFEIFCGVSGIGPRTGLDVLSNLSIGDLVRAIQFGNVNVLTSVPGIGRKRAERLIVELKDRVSRFPVPAEEPGLASHGAGAAEGAPVGSRDLYADAVAALEALGVKPATAARNVALALRDAPQPESITTEQLVRLALQVGR